MKHTLETLLPLLDSPEGLEKLRILTAEADGWSRKANKWGQPVILTPKGNELWHYDDRGNSYGPATTWNCSITKARLPNYPTSLDAIFAAEERIGLHNKEIWDCQDTWFGYAEDVYHALDGDFPDPWEHAFMTPARRCIPYILTAQEIREAGKDAE